MSNRGKLILHFLVLVLLLQSAGLLCDDCIPLSEPHHSRLQSHDGHDHDHQPDPCVSSLCSLCGTAFVGKSRRAPQLRGGLFLKLLERQDLYGYSPLRQLFRPPKA